MNLDYNLAKLQGKPGIIYIFLFLRVIVEPANNIIGSNLRIRNGFLYFDDVDVHVFMVNDTLMPRRFLIVPE